MSAFEANVRGFRRGHAYVTIEHDPEQPGRVRLVVDVEDDYGDVLLTAEQLDALLGVITTAAGPQ